MDDDRTDIKRILVLGTYLSLIAVISTFVVLSFRDSGMSGEVIAFLSLIVGGLLANLKEAVSWSFGSSQSSQHKDNIIANMASTAQTAQSDAAKVAAEVAVTTIAAVEKAKDTPADPTAVKTMSVETLEVDNMKGKTP